MTTVIGQGWFSELSSMWPGQSMSLEVQEVLCQEQSKFQNILVFKSKTFGNVLVLDGAIQCTERDEFAYHESLTHIPLFSHPDPKKVLVVGGGDGGMIREVLKHKCVESAHLCEIDEQVVEVSKRYLPHLTSGLSDPRLQIHIQDGMEYIDAHHNEFDVIITDAPDPVGPAVCLFQKDYFERVKLGLKPGGLMCLQAECQWLHLDFIKKTLGTIRELFPVVKYGFASIPSYPSGQLGFIVASTSQGTVLDEPLRKQTELESKEMKLKYYTPEVHKSAFSLPRFAKEVLE